MANKSGIHLNPAHAGEFTAKAKKAGMSVQAFAQRVMAHKESYDPETVKQANFASNAAGWKPGAATQMMAGK